MASDAVAEKSLSMTKDNLIELPLSDYHRSVEEAVNLLKGRVKHCGRSAFRHLRLAWKLYPIDKEMALFRAITAEEEAATALIIALRQKGYPGAEKLMHKSHIHKSALTPFLLAVGKCVSESLGLTPQIRLSKSAPPKLNLSIKIDPLFGEPGPAYLEPDHPFNFTAASVEAGTKSIHMFEQQLADLAAGQGARDLSDFIRKEANTRNKILYADDGGVPTVDFTTSLIVERLRRVCVLLVLTIGILQTGRSSTIRCSMFASTTAGTGRGREHSI